jgi:hypothetical protein
MSFKIDGSAFSLSRTEPPIRCPGDGMNLRILFATICGGLWILPAQGAVTTFNFTGVIFQVDAPLSGTFAIGEVITGSYTFDSSAPDSVPNDPSVGIYSSSLAYSVSAGSFVSTGTAFQFNIFNNLLLSSGILRDQYRVALGSQGQSVNGLLYNAFSLDLFTNGSNPISLTSDALPSSPPRITDFTNNQLRFYFVDPNDTSVVYYVVGSVSTLTEAPRFGGTPGKSNCHGQSVSALARQYGGLNSAAAGLGFSSVSALQNAILTFCGG